MRVSRLRSSLLVFLSTCLLPWTSLAVHAWPKANTNQNQAVSQRVPLKIMPLGDSITFGTPNPSYGGYRHLLGTLLTNDGYSFDFVGSQQSGDGVLPSPNNEGHPGWTILQIKNGIDSRGWLETYQPDVILLHIGTNDLRPRIGGAAAAPDNLSTLLDDILARLPQARVIVAEIIPFAPGPDQDHQAYNASIPGIVASKGPRVSIVDMQNVLHPSDYADRFHPKAGGYDKMARAWERALRPVISSFARRAEATAAPSASASAAAPNSAPSGLLVARRVNNPPQQDQALEQALKNPFINGVGFQIHWSDIEPVQGKPDWSKLDQLFAAAESSKKWVRLLIYPGFFSPAWALEGAKTEQFPVPYGPDQGKVMSLPLPWDSVYLDHWFEFLKQLSGRYGKSPAFKMIGAAGPTSVSVEMTLPPDPKKWQDNSYRPRKYIEAWQKVFQVYAADFPNQFISLSVGNAPYINDQGKIAPGEGERTRQAIVDQAMALLGRRFVLENDDLNAGPRQHRPTTFVMSYRGRVITGLEMRCAAELGTCSAGMGAPGDPPLALRKSIDKGMEPNSAGQHVNYLEIYEPDVLADEMQPVLRYGASLFAH
jgi:hypothetical protein